MKPTLKLARNRLPSVARPAQSKPARRATATAADGLDGHPRSAADLPGHRPRQRHAWLTSIQREEDVAISEFILAELYGLLRNPAELKRPLPADEALEVIQTYRTHPRWRLIGFPTESRALHDALCQKARAATFAFRKLYDTRSALTMTAQGVIELATVNVKDFEGLGFRRVWNPVDSAKH